ncbi:L,D-transpeptidase family protein [bacterium LRH843]|nr:L,D-transpeptidase family protein [bacterium LRH843]
MRNIFIIMISSFIFIGTTCYVQASEDHEAKHIYIDLWKNELQLMENGKVIETFTISPGTDENQTPIGEYKIIQKSKNWGSGFGTRWLGLNVPWGMYGIHGTNKPWLLGRRVSSGCIRMRNEDVEKLYELVPLHASVHIDGPIMGSGDAEYKRLSNGSKGNLVFIVQMRLKAAGYYKGEVDGIFDEGMEQAIKAFQKNEKIPITGRISRREYNRLGLLE